MECRPPISTIGRPCSPSPVADRRSAKSRHRVAALWPRFSQRPKAGTSISLAGSTSGEMVARCAQASQYRFSCWSHPYTGVTVNVRIALGWRLPFSGIHLAGTPNVRSPYLESNRAIATLTAIVRRSVPGKSIIAGQTRGADDMRQSRATRPRDSYTNSRTRHTRHTSAGSARIVDLATRGVCGKRTRKTLILRGVKLNPTGVTSYCRRKRSFINRWRRGL